MIYSAVWVGMYADCIRYIHNEEGVEPDKDQLQYARHLTMTTYRSYDPFPDPTSVKRLGDLKEVVMSWNQVQSVQ